MDLVRASLRRKSQDFNQVTSGLSRFQEKVITDAFRAADCVLIVPARHALRIAIP